MWEILKVIHQVGADLQVVHQVEVDHRAAHQVVHQKGRQVVVGLHQIAQY